VEDVMDWLETTFYYQRAQSAPDQYTAGSDLRTQVSETLSDLVADGFVEMDDLSVEGTPLGRLASDFYLRLATARRFKDCADRAAEDPDSLDEDAFLRAVAGASEFDSVSARSDEEDAVAAVLGSRGEDLSAGQRKVLAILRSSMSGTTPSELQSDAWVIKQNALRMLAALRAFLDRFAGPAAANLACRVEARVENGVSEDAVGLTAIDGVGPGRARTLAAEGLRTPADVVDAGVSGLVAAGLSESVAERVVSNAEGLPAVVVEWGDFPDRIGRGERELHEVTVRSIAGSARTGIRVTVNGHEMTTKPSYLGQATVPVAAFGGDAEELEFAIEVTFPELPIPSVVERRTVTVE